MFVPNLSWQNDRFYKQMAQKCRFSQGLRWGTLEELQEEVYATAGATAAAAARL
jgi:hypothetical protein